MNTLAIILIISISFTGAAALVLVGARVYHQGTKNAPPVIITPKSTVVSGPDPDEVEWEPNVFNPNAPRPEMPGDEE